MPKKENATETYTKLKDEYLIIKALLQVSGVNTDIDKSKDNQIRRKSNIYILHTCFIAK